MTRLNFLDHPCVGPGIGLGLRVPVSLSMPRGEGGAALLPSIRLPRGPEESSCRALTLLHRSFPVVSPKTISSPMARISGARSGSSPAPPDPANRSCRGNSPARKNAPPEADRLPASCRPAGFGLLELGFTPRRNGRGPSLWSTRRQSPGRISFRRRSSRRLPPGRAGWSSSRTPSPRGCRSI